MWRSRSCAGLSTFDLRSSFARALGALRVVAATQASAARGGRSDRPGIIVKPGQSIQAAIDRAAPGTTIRVKPGVYREVQNPTNGLNIPKSGIRLIGQPTEKKPVVLENAGDQRNGIVVVPADRTD